MKKIISIILLIAMLSSVCALFSGCEWGLSDEKLLQMKQDYIEQFEIEDKDAEDVLLEFYAGNFHGYDVVMLDAGHHDGYFDAVFHKEMIGGFDINYYDKNRLTAYKDGVFYTLGECDESGRLSVVDFFLISAKYNILMKGYHKVIDDYDYTWCSPIVLIPEYENDEDYDAIVVYMDPTFKKDGPDVPLSYFGKEFFSKIEDVNSYSYESLFVSYKLTLRHAGKENYLKAVEHLRNVNGIYGINCITLNPGAALPNDYPDDVLENWGLEMINVEKVWDFVTVVKI